MITNNAVLTTYVANGHDIVHLQQHELKTAPSCANRRPYWRWRQLSLFRFEKCTPSKKPELQPTDTSFDTSMEFSYIVWESALVRSTIGNNREWKKKANETRLMATAGGWADFRSISVKLRSFGREVLSSSGFGFAVRFCFVSICWPQVGRLICLIGWNSEMEWIRWMCNSDKWDRR